MSVCSKTNEKETFFDVQTVFLVRGICIYEKGENEEENKQFFNFMSCYAILFQ